MLRHLHSNPIRRRAFFLPAAIVVCLLSTCLSTHAAEDAGVLLEDRFDAGALGWKPVFDDGHWAVEDGEFRLTGDHSVSGRLSPVAPVADAMIEADVRVTDPQRRHNFGFFLRMQDDRTGVAVRYYDALKRLEVLQYNQGRVTPAPSGEKVAFVPGKTYRLKAAIVGDTILAKLYPADAAEPGWQLVEKLRPAIAGQDRRLRRRRHAGRLSQRSDFLGAGGCRAEAQPGRTASAPRRADSRRPGAEGRRHAAGASRQGRSPASGLRSPHRRRGSASVDGKLAVTFGDEQSSIDVLAKDYDGQGYLLRLPEPDAAKKLSLRFEALGKTMQCEARDHAGPALADLHEPAHPLRHRLHPSAAGGDRTARPRHGRRHPLLRGDRRLSGREPLPLDGRGHGADEELSSSATPSWSRR